jgi:hypothetical protein
MVNFQDKYGILQLAASLEHKPAKANLGKIILHFFTKAKTLLKYLKIIWHCSPD